MGWGGPALGYGAGALLLFPHLQLLFQKTMCEKWEAWRDPPSYVSILGQAEALKPLCSTGWRSYGFYPHAKQLRLCQGRQRNNRLRG